jgi:hypothetical protein
VAYPNHQYHYSWTFSPLSSKMRVTQTQHCDIVTVGLLTIEVLLSD